jgi:archaetidylinositol phosphate synthase
MTKLTSDRAISASLEVPFRAPKRIQGNLCAAVERDLLNRLCERLPSGLTPDHLTALGLAGAGLSFAAYMLSNDNTAYFFLASVGLLINWFGDSLDGSLARYRGIERVRFGYFIDHSTDAVSSFLIIAGLGLCPLVSMNAALFALVGYLMLSIHAFISNNISGQLKLSYILLGPTEVRILIIVLNTLMYCIGPLEIN